jgi:tellurite resistance protein TerC
MKVFRFLHTGLAAILILVGAKMIVTDYFRVPTLAMLGAVAGILTLSVAASILIPEKERT